MQLDPRSLARAGRLRRVGSCVSLGFLLGLLAPLAAAAQPLPCFHPIQLGVNGEDAARLRSAQVGWLRITFRWRDLQPAPGEWDLGRYDAQVEEARSQGLSVLAILSTAPEWAGSNPNGTRPPPDVSLWGEFVLGVAAHYRGRVAAYEVWNEPDLVDLTVGVGWTLDPSVSPRYVDYLRAASEAIRAAAPGTLVVGPATSSRTSSRTVELFTQLETTFPDGLRAPDLVDAISFHANAVDDETAAEVQGQVGSHLATLWHRNPGNLEKPVWITELGWKSNRIGELGQRQRIVSLLTTWSAGCDPGKPSHAFLFQERDIPGAESRGIFRADWTPKPIVSTYLAALPFPARTADPLGPPFSALCDGGSCELEATEWLANAFAAPTCTWDLGDGSRAEGCRVRHAYPGPEPRVVRLTVHLEGQLVHDRDALLLPGATCLDEEPPQAGILFPPPGSHLNGPVEVLVEAADNLALGAVKLLVDGRVEASAGPAQGASLGGGRDFGEAVTRSLPWDAAVARAGPRLLQVLTQDRCGNLALSLPVPVVVDRRRPALAILAPLAGSLLSGRQLVRVKASDNEGVASVTLYVDGRQLATAAPPPAAETPALPFRWNTARAADGPHRLTAAAVDLAGNLALSPPVAVRTDNSPPRLRVSHPAHLQGVGGPRVRLAGWALDGNGVASLAFELDGRPLPLGGPPEAVPRPEVCATFAAIDDPACPEIGWRTAFDSTLHPDGPHRLTITATDQAGVTARSELTVFIANGAAGP